MSVTMVDVGNTTIKACIWYFGLFVASCCKSQKPMNKFQIPREQFPCSIFVANVTKMSLTCYEEIGRVGRVTRMLRGTAPMKVRLSYVEVKSM